MSKIKLILSTMISLVLFAGGIILLLANLPFWSVFFGIPAIQIGIVFIIITFDKLFQNSDDNMNIDETEEEKY